MLHKIRINAFDIELALCVINFGDNLSNLTWHKPAVIEVALDATKSLVNTTPSLGFDLHCILHYRRHGLDWFSDNQSLGIFEFRSSSK